MCSMELNFIQFFFFFCSLDLEGNHSSHSHTISQMLIGKELVPKNILFRFFDDTLNNHAEHTTEITVLANISLWKP